MLLNCKTLKNEKKGFKKYSATFLEIFRVFLKIYKKYYKGIYWQGSASETSLECWILKGKHEDKIFGNNWVTYSFVF
jgi:hypothetical protein